MKVVPGLDKIAIVGAGQMGYGIGVDFARAGFDTYLYNRSEAASDRAMQQIFLAFDLFVQEELLTRQEADQAIARLHPTTSVELAVQDASYVVESITESLPQKRSLFVELDRLCKPTAIISSNASTLTTSQMVNNIGLKYPWRFCLTHYFFPAHLLPLVEISGGDQTSAETLDSCVELLSSIGKKPVLIPLELAGGVGNRLQAAMALEISRLLKKKACSPAIIDQIIMNSFGRRMAMTGWFIRSDWVGLDKLYKASIDAGKKPLEVVASCVEQGHYGMSVGRGVYDWPDQGAAVQQKLYKELIHYLKQDLQIEA